MKRWSYFIYGVVCHGLFLATYAYLAGFVGNLLVPRSIDAPAVGGSVVAAIGINLALVLVFALQHSVMARPAFKRLWTRAVPATIERSTYVLVSCVVTWLLMWQWRPLDAVIWETSGVARTLLWALFAAGWLMVPGVTLMIDHFDLFGTRQVWLYLRRRPYTSLPFRAKMFYRYVRHPLYVGWALAFWATPTMTAGHLLFAGSMSLYMGLAALVEERDLVAHFGHVYERYRRTVPMFVPRLPKSSDEVPAYAETAVEQDTLV
jgi:protein-S-isoprenylcysteine O-methyltransferase Ste14